VSWTSDPVGLRARRVWHFLCSVRILASPSPGAARAAVRTHFRRGDRHRRGARQRGRRRVPGRAGSRRLRLQHRSTDKHKEPQIGRAFGRRVCLSHRRFGRPARYSASPPATRGHERARRTAVPPRGAYAASNEGAFPVQRLPCSRSSLGFPFSFCCRIRGTVSASLQRWSGRSSAS
jgi:hypothetical protein